MRILSGQYTLGSLMIVIAAVAGLLAVPGESWHSIARWALNGVALLILGLVGFGLGHAGSKLAIGVGETFGRTHLEERPEFVEAERPPCPPT